MKKELNNISLIVFFVITFIGIILCGIVLIQYHIESISPSDEKLRVQIDRVYNKVTQEDIDYARDKIAEAENKEAFVIDIIKGEQSMYTEISMHQNSRGFNNACKVVIKKLDVILKDIEAGKVDELKAYAAMMKILREPWEYKDIINVPYSDELNFFRTVEKLSFLSAVLVITGITGMIAILIRRRRRKAARANP